MQSPLAPLKIAVAVPVRKGGSWGMYKHLYSLLDNFGSEVNVTVFAPEGSVVEEMLCGFRLVEVSPIDYRRNFREMSKAIDLSDCEVVLSLVARPLRGLSKPVVTIVQNIEPLQKRFYRTSFLGRLRLWALRREHRISCKAAVGVIAVSKYVKAQLVAEFSLDPRKIITIYHGADRGGHIQMPDLPAAVARRFLFSAGSVVPYRGYEDLVVALGMLRSEGVDFPPVVIAGAKDAASSWYDRKLKGLIDYHSVGDKIVWLGGISASEMAWCYKNCAIFIQTSRAEACPNIVIESLQFGCLVVSTDQLPMPELYGEGAVYYRRGDSASLADKLKMILRMSGDEAVAMVDDVSERNANRAMQFSWKKTADRTVAALKHFSLASKRSEY